MKVRVLVVSALCALAVSSAPPAHAANRSMTIEAKLERVAPGDAAGTAQLRTVGAGAQFSIKTSGLTPGVCEVRVGGSLEALLFVDEKGTGDVLFDTALFEKTVARGDDQEMDLGPLTLDPRGKTLQISRNGQVLLEVNFPAGPPAGSR